MSTEIEAIKQIYAAINRNDVAAALTFFDVEIERFEFETTVPSHGTYRGLSALQTHIEQGRNTWAEGSCTPLEFYSHKDKIVVVVHVHVRLKDHAEWIDAFIADGFVFKDGKATQMNSFAQKSQAFLWARIPPVP